MDIWITLYTKGDYGMLRDNGTKDTLAEKCLEVISDVLGKDAEFISMAAGERDSDFQIKFFLPIEERFICLESFMGLFTVEIENDKGAKNSLYRIEKFDNRTSVSNVRKSIRMLKSKMEEEEIPLFLSEKGKLYKFFHGERKTVRSVME